MNISNIRVKYLLFDSFPEKPVDRSTHEKTLPFLSIVEPVVGGYGVSLDGGNGAVINSGEFFIAPSLVNQKITNYPCPQSGTMKARWLFIDVTVNDSLPLDGILDIPLKVSGENADRLNRLFDQGFKAKSYLEKLGYACMVLDIIVEISQAKKFTLNIQPALSYISEHYAESIDIKFLAQTVCLSPSRFYTVFKKETGRRPVEYINNYRLIMAENMLLSSNETVQNIAYSVGFDDMRYFGRLFRNKWGMTATEYRKKMKQSG
ncbi:MAG: helix-turn-helix transcriptional regulator [Oscillospiraceae bacterium]|nr:helix-turn-helix transcriptional regulator [Candidatus Equicaccousia limihippi]